MTHTQVYVAMSYIVQINHNVLLWLTITIKSGYSENEKAISVSHPIKYILNLEL